MDAEPSGLEPDKMAFGIHTASLVPFRDLTVRIAARRCSPRSLGWLILSRVSDPLERLRKALAHSYVVEREIGHGGMASVYLARDLKHDREVAVKVLRSDIAASLGAERFVREIKVAANLQHPHILPLYDSGEADDFLYYVMPYVKGQSLRERLAASGELPIGQVIRIVGEVADALAHAHRAGVVHRDIKPDNIMLTERHALVMDFGVAKAVSEATGRQGITTAGVALGTPAYMAPEQATADPNLDHRVDVYALGVLAYEMLTGQPPFTENTAQALLAAHATQAPVPVTSRRATVPPALADVVSKCLEKSPADRFQTAEELLSRIDTLSTPSGGVTPTEATPTTAAAPVPQGRRRYVLPAIGVAIAAVLVLLGTLIGGGGPAGGAGDIDPRSIAVLPLTSVRSDEESQAFAAGLHDDILTQLSKIGDLKVISRTSVMEYGTGTRNIRDIADQLQVANILEGQVQRSGNRIRLNAQLIDADTDVHLWAETYDAELTVDEIFSIQSDLARQIASALQATLSPDEQRNIDAVPTEDLEAYDLYVRGRDYLVRAGYRGDNYAFAEQLFRNALDLDQQFALAAAGLSLVHSRTYFLAFDQTESRRSQARDAAERALEIDPDLPEGHFALGYYHYYGHRDYENAMREFAIAEPGMPGSNELHEAKGYVQRRLGLWDESLASFDRAAELNPRSAELLYNWGASYELLGRYDEAIEMFDRALIIAPDFLDVVHSRGTTILNRDGDTGPLRAAVAGFGPETQTLTPVPWLRWFAEMIDHDFAAAALVSGGERSLVESQARVWPISFLRGIAHYAAGALDEAGPALDSARVLLEEELRTSPDDARVVTTLGVAYAGLGRKEDAIREGLRAVDLLPLERDAVVAPDYVLNLTFIYAMVGESDLALEALEQHLSHPRNFSTLVLQRHPLLGALHDDPRFQELIRRAPY